MAQLKRGKLNTAEKEFLLKNLDVLSDEQIAKQLNRMPELVARYRVTANVRRDTMGDINPEDLAIELKTKSFWSSLEKQFSYSELLKFKKMWIELVGQFKQQGIQVADEYMIKDYIILELMLDQTLEMRQMLTTRIDTNTKLISEEMKQEDRDPAALAEWHTAVSNDRSTLLATGREIKELEKLKNDKFRDLKATREQRFKAIEESSKNIGELIKILNEREVRKAEGRRNALCQLCVEKEVKRFGKLHRFGDDIYRRPLLNSETINFVQEEDIDDSHSTNLSE